MNMQSLLKQAQDVREKMERELGETYAEASVGGDMVRVKMNGYRRLVAIHIQPDVLQEETGLVEDLILSAVNEAHRKMDETLREKLGSTLTGMPGLF